MRGILLRTIKKKMRILFIILCVMILLIALMIVFFRIRNSLQSKIDADMGIQENIYITISCLSVVSFSTVIRGRFRPLGVRRMRAATSWLTLLPHSF